MGGIAPIFAKIGLVKTDPLTALTIRTGGVTAALLLMNILGGKVGALNLKGVRNPRLFLVAGGLLVAAGVFLIKQF